MTPHYGSVGTPHTHTSPLGKVLSWWQNFFYGLFLPSYELHGIMLSINQTIILGWVALLTHLQDWQLQADRPATSQPKQSPEVTEFRNPTFQRGQQAAWPHKLTVLPQPPFSDYSAEWQLSLNCQPVVWRVCSFVFSNFKLPAPNGILLEADFHV